MELLSIKQVAALCGVNWPKIRDWFDWGVIPAPVIVGGFARWRRSDLDAWQNAGCPQAASPLENLSDQVAEAILAELRATRA